MVIRRAHAVMVLGTASSVGKSLIATALCRIFARTGRSVAPFKAQNMSLNSAATPDGREIGRAQALQAEAAGVSPSADMNPVLLKPMSTLGAQAVVDGRVWGTIQARDYAGETKRALWPHVCAAYDRLAKDYELIVIEGAGSPAEINLREGDIVNMNVAHYSDARALLVADIDRGGAFAAVAGTFALLDERDRARIAGYAFNKFRGDQTLLASGIEALDARVGAPCLGVIPFLDVSGLDEEDGVSLERRTAHSRPWTKPGKLRIAVVAFPHLSNFTDFDALEEEASVDLRYVASAEGLADADVVILPGTKNTLGDLRWAFLLGIDRAIRAAVERKAIVIGICGGMQMLGKRIDDPLGIEEGGMAAGFGELDLQSQFSREKITFPIEGISCAFGDDAPIGGYEIHAGETTYAPQTPQFATIRRKGSPTGMRDGVVAGEGRVIGTYVHGLFASDATRHAFLRWAMTLCGKTSGAAFTNVASQRASRLDGLADAVELALDIRALLHP